MTEDGGRKGRDYEAFYGRITARIRNKKDGTRILKSLNDIICVTMGIVYPLLLCMIGAACFRGGLDLRAAAMKLLPFILVPGVSFILLTLIRSRIDRKRPYEQHAIHPLIPRDKKGESMPSRHVFSSAVISMCVLKLSVPLGAALLLMTAVSAVVRVLAGVHFPEDVAVGYAAGVASGCLLFLF